MLKILNSVFLWIIGARHRMMEEINSLENSIKADGLSLEMKKIVQNRVEQLSLKLISGIDEEKRCKRQIVYFLFNKYNVELWEIKRAYKYIRNRIDYNDQANSLMLVNPDSTSIKKHSWFRFVYAILGALLFFFYYMFDGFNSFSTFWEGPIVVVMLSVTLLMVTSYKDDDNISIKKANKILHVLEDKDIS